MFRTTLPAVAQGFFDRTRELATLKRHVQRLEQGAPSWVALLGSRKIGKTSLLLELARSTRHAKLAVVVLDVFEWLPVSLEVLRSIAVRVVDALFSAELGVSLEAIQNDPAAFQAALQQSEAIRQLSPTLRTTLLKLPHHELDRVFLRECIDLPERLAEALDVHIVIAIDEFQELAQLPAKTRKEVDPIPLLRSLWQRHQRVGYIISGSERGLLTELVTSKRSPFFQHFALLDLGPFAKEDAAFMLEQCAPEDRPIPRDLVDQAVEVLGGQPFYLQLLGHSLTQRPPPYDASTLKEVLQELLFSGTGQLALYFENEYRRLVGRSTGLAETLASLAEGPLRLSEIAAAVKTDTGSTRRSIERLGDAITHVEGRYQLFDPTFALWLRWRQPGGSVVPMKVIGDEAEAEVAAHLARLGFDLVYQSRASRGAFDLLATRGAQQLGLQVKQAKLPLRFDQAAWTRMEAEATRFGWRWGVAVLIPSPTREVVILDPAHARKTKLGRVLYEEARIDNLLAWLDTDRPTSAETKTPKAQRRTRKPPGHP